MSNYKTFTTVTDYGPYVTKLILEMPCEVREDTIRTDSFNVYTERRDINTGEVLLIKNFLDPAAPAYLSKGYQTVLAAYPSNAQGQRLRKGSYVTLELGEAPLSKRIEGTMLTSGYIDHAYRVTLLHEIGDDEVFSGLVFDTCDGDICPQLLGWSDDVCEKGEIALKYGYYNPIAAAPAIVPAGPFFKPFDVTGKKLPLVIWLHGAGEGGQDPKVAYTGNKVVNISADDIQKKLGGAAWVLVPQCPTVWMDDGKEQLGHSNYSIYTKSLKACIDEFIEKHADSIDTNRILIGGCSNGGFMTVRMIIDYPDFFAAAYPVCQAFFSENVTEAMIENMAKMPIWFIHAKNDELVNPKETALPLYHRLMAAGAGNVHFTYINRNEDVTGMYKDELGRPKRIFNHGVWVHVYNDDCLLDFNGQYVVYNGEPVSLWEWLGRQSK